MLDSIENAVRDTLGKFLQDWNTGSRMNWTSEIAMRLCLLSKTADWDYGACARGTPPGSAYGEWLYDICWFHEDDVCLTHLPLVVECEWSPDGACDGDFQKLLQARADHRPWIFQVATTAAAASMFEGSKSNIERFRASQSGDRYLFAAFVPAETASFQFCHYVHP